MSGRDWLVALGALVLVALGIALLDQGGAFGLLGAIAVAAGVAGIVAQLLRLSGDERQGTAGGAARAARNAIGFLEVSKMSSLGQWAAGVAMGVLALLGLFLVSRSADGMFTVFGSLLFLFGIAAVVILVHRATDYSHAAAAADDDQPA